MMQVKPLDTVCHIFMTLCSCCSRLGFFVLFCFGFLCVCLWPLYMAYGILVP